MLVALSLLFGIFSPVLTDFSYPAAAAENILYVDGNLGTDDAHCGTSENLCKTIQYALAKAESGDTIHIATGTYLENMVIDKALTIKCANAGISAGAIPGTRGAETVIQGEATVSAANVVIDGCHFIRPAGLGQLNAVPKLINSNVDGEVTVQNSKLDMTLPGSVSDAFPNGSSACGSGVSGTAKWRVYNNELKNVRYSGCTAGGIQYNSRAIFADSGRRIVVEGNRFFNTGQGVYITGFLADESEIRGNLFTSLGTAGVFVGAPQNVVIEGNTFEGYGGVYLDSSVNTVIQNNLFKSSNWFALNTDGNHSDTVVRNNAILGMYPTGYGSYTGKTVFNTATGDVNAENNWWGQDASETTISGLISKTGAGNITFTPWITSYEPDPEKVGKPGFWPLKIGSAAKLPASVLDQVIELTNVEGSPSLTLPPSTTPINISIGIIEPASLPAGSVPFQVQGAVLIDIDITGTFAPGAEFIICVDGAAPQRLWHFTSGAWQDITRTDINEAGKVCGVVTSFSPFALAALIPPPPPPPPPQPTVIPIVQNLTAAAGVAINPTVALTALNFNSTVSYTISPALPLGLSFDAATGVVLGTPTAVQVLTSYRIVGKSDSQTAIATINIVINPGISPVAQNILATAGKSLTPTAEFVSLGFTGAVNFTISPTLPAGLQLSATTGEITGIPTTAQSKRDYLITAIRTGGASSESATSIISIEILASILSPTGGETQDFYFTINEQAVPTTEFKLIGFVGSVSYSISPALPAGLSLNPATGVLAGVPSLLTNQLEFTKTATGATAGSASIAITISVLPPLVAPAASRATAGDGFATINWSEVAGATDYEVVSNPAGSSCVVTVLTARCSNLTNGSRYSFRVFAVNQVGIAKVSRITNAVIPKPESISKRLQLINSQINTRLSSTALDSVTKVARQLQAEKATNLVIKIEAKLPRVIATSVERQQAQQRASVVLAALRSQGIRGQFSTKVSRPKNPTNSNKVVIKIIYKRP